MSAELYEQVKANPKFKQLVNKRSRWVWTLSSIILLMYFAFILLIAFAPQILGQTLHADTVMTVGIPVGVLLIVSAFVLTGVYVHKANTEFDQLTQALTDELSQ